MLDGVTAVYRSNVDLFFYVIGAQSENEVFSGPSLRLSCIGDSLTSSSCSMCSLDCTIHSVKCSSEGNMAAAVWYTGMFHRSLFRRNVEKQSLFEHMEVVMLLLDELVDGG